MSELVVYRVTRAKSSCREDAMESLQAIYGAIGAPLSDGDAKRVVDRLVEGVEDYVLNVQIPREMVELVEIALTWGSLDAITQDRSVVDFLADQAQDPPDSLYDLRDELEARIEREEAAADLIPAGGNV